MNFTLNEINSRVLSDPRGFLAECDVMLEGRVAQAAAAIATAAKPVVLLTGPSGSGKTTTAGKMARALQYIGMNAYVVSMDDYFRTVDIKTHPRDKKGNIDYESPECLDLELLSRHFAELSAGNEIQLPVFDFPNQMRSDTPGQTMRLGKDEVAIFEGIHALNPSLLNKGTRVTKVYVSVKTSIRNDGEVLFKNTWMRLLRRVIRDEKFRGSAALDTMKMWASIRNGEKKYISPYKELADITIDTTLAYELSALRDIGIRVFSEIPETIDRYAELKLFKPRLEAFAPIEERILSKKSLLREFIGNSPVVLG